MNGDIGLPLQCWAFIERGDWRLDPRLLHLSNSLSASSFDGCSFFVLFLSIPRQNFFLFDMVVWVGKIVCIMSIRHTIRQLLNSNIIRAIVCVRGWQRVQTLNRIVCVYRTHSLWWVIVDCTLIAIVVGSSPCLFSSPSACKGDVDQEKEKEKF